MPNSLLVRSLQKAEEDIAININSRHDARWLYRLKRYVRHPYRFVRIAFNKWGVGPGDATTQTFFGRSFCVPLSDINALDIFYAGSLRPSEGRVTRFLLNALSEGAVFYDIGANYGFYSALAIALGARVHAFEPGPVYAYLARNAAEATLNHLALSDTKGVADFFDTSKGHKSGMSTMNQSIASSLPIDYIKMSVATDLLDTYVAMHEPPTVIKIDTEGFESKVLAGARTLLAEHAPRIVMEVWGDEGKENSLAAIALLNEYGYVSYAIEADGSVTPTTIDIEALGEWNNFVFIKE